MTTEDPDLVDNAGDTGGFFSMFVDPLARQTPAANEARGDQRLAETRRVAIEYESVLSVKDREAIEDMITNARDVKMGLESKSWGIAKFMQAREYRRAATRALRFTKTKTDSTQILWQNSDEYTADGPEHCPIRLGDPRANPSTDPILARVIGVAQHLYRCYLSCRDAFPTPNRRAEWAEIVWCEASVRTGSYPGPSFKREWFTIRSMDFLTDVRMKVRQAVETLYGFDADDMSNNAACARQLLSDNAFIHREYNYGENLQYPYRNPIIQEAINILWFKNREDYGITFQEHFSPMPIQAIALVLAVTQCCIDEWSDGKRKESDWDEKRFETVYRLHIKSLNEFHDHDNADSGDPFEVIRGDLLRNASNHADSSDTRKARDAAYEEDRPAHPASEPRKFAFKDEI